MTLPAESRTLKCSTSSGSATNCAGKQHRARRPRARAGRRPRRRWRRSGRPASESGTARHRPPLATTEVCDGSRACFEPRHEVRSGERAAETANNREEENCLHARLESAEGHQYRRGRPRATVNGITKNDPRRRPAPFRAGRSSRAGSPQTAANPWPRGPPPPRATGAPSRRGPARAQGPGRSRESRRHGCGRA